MHRYWASTNGETTGNCELNFMCDFSVLMWSYFNCGTILSGGLNINAEIIEGEYFYVTVEKEEDHYFFNSW